MAVLTEEQLKKGLKDIPPLPSAVAEILDALNQEDITVDFLGNKISKDPALSTRVLAMANSPFYGMSGTIASITQACMILGISSLKHVALAAGVFNNFPANSGNQISNMDIWQHALGTASAAKVIAGQIGADKDIAFTAGLLHDIGRMVLDYCFPEEYAQVIAYQGENNANLCEAEVAVLGISHSKAGETVAKRWHLPEIITIVIRDHHSHEQEDDDIMVEIIRAANVICLSLELGKNDDSATELKESTLRHLGMDIQALMELKAEVEELNQSSDLLLG